MSPISQILLPVMLTLASMHADAEKAFDGVYRANGKDAKIAYAVAQKGEPFHDMPVYVLVFSEKDAGKGSNVDADARAGKFGDALIVKLCKTDWGWDVIGNNFVHSGLTGGSASGSGQIKVQDVVLAGGEIRGKLKTNAGEKIAGQTLDVNLTFHPKTP